MVDTPIETTAVAVAPPHGLSNIMGSPGSTWAAIAVVLSTLGTLMHSQTLPTTGQEWVMFGITGVTSIMAAIGR